MILRGIDFINILKFLLSNVLEINFEIPQIYGLSPNLTVKFPKNFFNSSLMVFFFKFYNFSPISSKFSSNS